VPPADWAHTRDVQNIRSGIQHIETPRSENLSADVQWSRIST
jgi:hypothetical protein